MKQIKKILGSEFVKKISGFKFDYKLISVLILMIAVSCGSPGQQSIDRYQLVNRHNVHVKEIDSLASLSVGNGEFAFTAGITGLQTFPEYYDGEGVSLGTQSHWGWHSLPNKNNYSLDELYKNYQVGDRKVPYIYRFGDEYPRKAKASEWLRENPHRLHLGLIGLKLEKENGQQATINDIKNPDQKLNLWTGELSSKFSFEGTQVNVKTLAHQDLDMISAKISSELIKQNKLKLKFRFPYGSTDHVGPGYNFNKPDQHQTTILNKTSNSVLFKRKLDTTTFYVKLDWDGKATLQNPEKHKYLLVPSKENNDFSFSCLFTEDEYEAGLPDFQAIARNNKTTWEKFWKSGGAVDFSRSEDPRAEELERRVVLSQYLTRIQSSGSLPPQETGLTFNSWYGKFHLEMHWWHATHFIAWNRPELMDQQLDYYKKIIDKARYTAEYQGYDGVRWPKMTSFTGRESPSGVGTFLIWQQPHIIYFTELLYQNSENKQKILEEHKNLVFETANFMASYARWDSTNQRYVLGPALISAQEVFRAETTVNPTYELAYWYWGLKTAQKWRERLGLQSNPDYQHVLDNLSELPVKNNRYLFTENRTDSYTNPECMDDHPIVLGAYGFVPNTPLIDKLVFDNTLQTVLEEWHWSTTWGWDYPLAAMAATRMNKPNVAVDMLLKDVQKNTYLVNGHNYQDSRLRIYLPGNGGLLYAVAMICNESGFPQDWHVKYENLGQTL